MKSSMGSHVDNSTVFGIEIANKMAPGSVDIKEEPGSAESGDERCQRLVHVLSEAAGVISLGAGTANDASQSTAAWRRKMVAAETRATEGEGLVADDVPRQDHKRPRREGSLRSEAAVGDHNDGPSSRTRDNDVNERYGDTGAGLAVSVSHNRTSRERQVSGAECPYMMSINRGVLDFDFEKVCSVSLEKHNVYACLVCGKYFQGRGSNSHAYFHALEQGHHLYINLETEKVYCLPDNYEVMDSSLNDIKFSLNPQYTPEEVAKLDHSAQRYRALDGQMYTQGVMGMNNMNATDYANVVLQALIAVTRIRDIFLLFPRRGSGSVLAQRMGELVRKVHNPKAFRAHISPHEFMQEVVTRSNKRFKILEQGDPVEFMTWLLNTLHLDLQDSKGQSIITSCFQGEVLIRSQKELGATKGASSYPPPKMKKTKANSSNFYLLSLDLPPKPLFRDGKERNMIPQIPLHTLLDKFNGVSKHHIVGTGHLRTYTIQRLPRYLIIHIKRFARNNFFLEKNPTIVPFPAKNLELRHLLSESAVAASMNTKYDLIAAIVHEGTPTDGSYMVNVRHSASGQWFSIQDLHVKETLPQLVALAEAHILIYEAQQPTTSEITLSTSDLKTND